MSLYLVWFQEFGLWIKLLSTIHTVFVRGYSRRAATVISKARADRPGQASGSRKKPKWRVTKEETQREDRSRR